MSKGGRLDASITLPSGVAATFRDEGGEVVVTIKKGEWFIADLVAEINAGLNRKEQTP